MRRWKSPVADFIQERALKHNKRHLRGKKSSRIVRYQLADLILRVPKA